MNSEASNDPFASKKKIYEKSGYAITRALADYDDWNTKEIRKRSKEMAEESVELWPLPAKYNQDVSSGTWQMDDQIEGIFNQLCETVKDYDPSIYEEPKKQYINFLRDRKAVMSVIPCQSYILIVLNAKTSDLSPNENLEDVSEKGHWGIGDSRIKITSEEDIWVILEYIDQIIKSWEV